MPVLTFEQSKALEEKMKSAAETVVVVEAPVAEAPKQQKRKGKKK